MKKITMFVLTAIIAINLFISNGFEKKNVETVEDMYIQIDNEDDCGVRG